MRMRDKNVAIIYSFSENKTFWTNLGFWPIAKSSPTLEDFDRYPKKAEEVRKWGSFNSRPCNFILLFYKLDLGEKSLLGNKLIRGGGGGGGKQNN